MILYRQKHYFALYYFKYIHEVINLFNFLPNINKGITAFIGSGGKTTLIHTLCSLLSENNKVIFCTTTNIYPSETIHCVNTPTLSDVEHELKTINAICIGNFNSNTKKLQSPDFSIEKLKELADYILVEADGSKSLPIKAHNPYEPVIPAGCNETILVIGASGFGKKIEDAVHRKEIFCDIANCNENDIVTPNLVSKVINHENLADKIFVNQVDNDNLLYIPKDLEILTNKTVYYGSLQKGRFKNDSSY